MEKEFERHLNKAEGKMQRRNFFVVRQSLEWKRSNANRGKSSNHTGEIWYGHGLAAHKPDSVPSHLIVKTAPQISSLFVHLRFSGKSVERNS